MAGAGTNYFANLQGAPQILQGTPNYNIEISEGQTPPGEFYPAHYLPAVVSENRLAGAYYVWMSGKVLSLDNYKRLLPAGLAYETTAAGSGSAVIKYTSLDISAQTRNPGSNPTIVTEGDTVATKMMAAGVYGNVPIGIARYSKLQAPGTNPSNPATFFKHAYDTGGAAAFSRYCYVQMPVVEVNARAEVMSTTSATGITNSDYRIALWPVVNTIKFYASAASAAAGSATTLTEKANPSLLAPATGTVPTEYARIGRTFFFNYNIPAGWMVQYTPDVSTPFTCLKVDYGTGKIIGVGGASGVYALGTDSSGAYDGDFSDFICKRVSYDKDSNFSLTSGRENIGRILDVKVGSNDDLKLVRTYFRDQGLWQEGPGSATDGRNTQLALANAPRYIVRVAVNFNGLNF